MFEEIKCYTYHIYSLLNISEPDYSIKFYWLFKIGDVCFHDWNKLILLQWSVLNITDFSMWQLEAGLQPYMQVISSKQPTQNENFRRALRGQAEYASHTASQNFNMDSKAMQNTEFCLGIFLWYR